MIADNYQSLAYKYTHERQNVWNILVILYIIIAYIAGLILIVSPNIFGNFSGFFCLTHAIVLSSYMTHEFIHNTVFKQKITNAIGISIMAWINGSCYFDFSKLTKLHMAHHRDKIDLSSVELSSYIERMPFQKALLFLEWLHFPAIFLWLRWRQIVFPFFDRERSEEKTRIASVLAIRMIFLGILAYLSPMALILYTLSFAVAIIILQFMDAFQHTYEVFAIEGRASDFNGTIEDLNSRYEQENTFTNVLSRRFWFLNILLLNFGYHNAHHAVMNCPWYNLPFLDRELFPPQSLNHLPFFPLVNNYHQFRIFRIFNEQGQAIEGDRQNLERFYGAIGVSLLVPVGKLSVWQEYKKVAVSAGD